MGQMIIPEFQIFGEFFRVLVTCAGFPGRGGAQLLGGPWPPLYLPH